VSGDNPIPDSQITASSEYGATYATRYARINNTAGDGGWLCTSAEYDAPEPRMYIQVCSLVTISVTQTRNKNVKLTHYDLCFFDNYDNSAFIAGLVVNVSQCLFHDCAYVLC